MRGSGTKTDPYMIETWDDFFDPINHDGKCHMLARDLDGNDYNGGVFELNNAVPYNLDGNGHTIRNVAYHGDYSSANYYLFYNGGGVWKNLKLENIDVGVGLFNGNSHYMYFENCEISAKCFCINVGGATKFIDSVVSIDAATQRTRCDWLRSHGRIMMESPESTNNALMMHNVVTSRLEIDVRKSPGGTQAPLNPLTVANGVLAISLPEDWNTEIVVNGDPLQPSVMDSTLLHGNSTAQITGVILLPTEDMKNADKLNAAGFLVERVY